MEQTTAAEEQYWTLIVAGVPQLDESGLDEPLIDELVAGVKPILISYLPQDPRVLYVVVKSLSAALDAQKWLYKRKRQGKYEIISGLVGTVGFATGLTGDFGKKMRYRSPELTDEMWQEIGLAEADLAHSPEPPRRRRGEDPLSTPSFRSFRRLRVPRPDPLKVKSRLSVRARIQSLVKFKTRILSVKSSSSAKSKRPSRPKCNNSTLVSGFPTRATSARSSAPKTCRTKPLSPCATSSASASGSPNLTAKLLLLTSPSIRLPGTCASRRIPLGPCLAE